MSVTGHFDEMLKIATWVAGFGYIVLCVVSGFFSLRKYLIQAESINSATVPHRLWTKVKIPPQPEFFRPFSGQFQEQCEEKLNLRRRLLVTGPSGIGKTTFALEIASKYLKLNGNSPLKQLPIYIPLAQKIRGTAKPYLKPENTAPDVFSRIEDAIVQATKISEKKIKLMLNEGCFLLIIDDLDYLNDQSQEQMQSFIRQSEKNSFLCIMIDKPERYFDDFDTVELQGWDRPTVKEYIHERIAKARKKTKAHDENEARFLEELNQYEVFQGSLTPLDARCLVDCYIETPTRRVMFDPELNERTRRLVFRRYLNVVIRRPTSEQDWVVEKIGRLALSQLVNERSYFLLLESHVELDRLRELVASTPAAPSLLKEDGPLFSFVHFKHQFVLAVLFFDQYPAVAQKIIGDAHAPMERLVSKMQSALQDN